MTAPRVALLNPTYKCCDVAASSVMAAFDASLNWVSCASPAVFAATSDQSPGLHWVPVDGLQDQSCGPTAVLRAAKSRPPNTAIAGTARSAGSRSEVLVVARLGLTV